MTLTEGTRSVWKRLARMEQEIRQSRADLVGMTLCSICEGRGLEPLSGYRDQPDGYKVCKCGGFGWEHPDVPA